MEAVRQKWQKTNEAQSRSGGTKKEIAEDRWRDKHELLFLTEEMVLQAFVSLQKQLLVSG